MKSEASAEGSGAGEPEEGSISLQADNAAEDDSSPTSGSTPLIAAYGDADVLRSDAPGVDHPGQVSPPMHPLHPGGQVMSMPGQQVAAAGPNSGSEVELARRLGVRFDSSNAAWVARWVESHSEKKKSRWFSVAKYGEVSARRLAIQACLQNMKPADFPSLRDLHDVLASFAANPPNAGAVSGQSYAHGLVSGADISGAGAAQQMGSVGRGGGLDAHNMAGYGGGKMPPGQYMHPHQMMQHPFAAIHGVPSYMAAVAAAGGMPPGGMGMQAAPHATQLNAVFCQGVPQHQAAPGYCLDASDEEVAANPTTAGEVEGTALEVPKMEDEGALNGGEPTEAPVPGYLMPQAAVSSHDSSSDLETHSAVSDDDDDLDSQDKGSDYEGESGGKRKKRKLEENAASLAHMNAAQAGMSMGGVFGNQGQNASLHPSYYSLYSPAYQHPFMQMNAGQSSGGAVHPMSFMPPGYPISLLHHMHPAAAAGFMPHMAGHHMDMSQSGSGMYMTQGGHFSQQQPGLGSGAVDSPQSQSTTGSPTSGTSPGVDGGAGFGGAGGGSYKRLTSTASAAGGPGSMTAKMTCERGLHYSKCYRGSQECWIAVWNTKGGRIMHEAFDVAQMGFEQAKAKAREARDAAHSNNVAVSENSRPSWKSHSNTGIPHVSLDSQQLRFRAHKFGRRLCRSFSFGRRRGSYASRENAFDAAVLWLIQTPTEDEIAAVSGRGDGV